MLRGLNLNPATGLLRGLNLNPQPQPALEENIMPILDIQQRFRELGRLRMGKVETPPGKRPRPVKLLTWRLTSPWKHLLEAAAGVGIGGDVVEWHNPGMDRAEFELITDTDTLDVIIPPGDVLNQSYELWSGGGCLRRCDGVTMTLDAGKTAAKKCRCPADPLERQAAAGANPPIGCKPTTRLVVMLPGLPDLGVWRLESHGFYAAAELAGAAALVEIATRRGTMIPADLRIEARRIKRHDEPVKRFAVPVLSFRGNLGNTLDALGFRDGDRPVEIASARPALNAGGAPELPSPAESGGFARAAPIEPNAPDLGEVDTPPAFDPPAAIPDERTESTTMPPDRMLAMRAREAGILDPDRRRLYQAITEGRTTTGKDLTVDEIRQAFVVIDGVRDGHIGIGVVRDRNAFAVYDRRAKRTLYRLAGDFPLEPSDGVEKPEEPHVEEPDPFVAAGVATEAEPLFAASDLPSEDAALEDLEAALDRSAARANAIDSRVIDDDEALTPDGPAGTPHDAAGWRVVLKAHGARVLDALKVTGTPSLDGLTEDQAEALLIWLELGGKG